MNDEKGSNLRPNPIEEILSNSSISLLRKVAKTANFNNYYRVINQNQSGEVKYIGHFALRCGYVAEERERIKRLMGERE